MCPACIPAMVLIVTGASSTSGLFALAVKMFDANRRMKVWSQNANQRRIDHDYGDEQEGRSESSVASGMG
jgi:hypothetical protein